MKTIIIDCESGLHAAGLVPTELARVVIEVAREDVYARRGLLVPRHRAYGFVTRCHLCDVFICSVQVDGEDREDVTVTAPEIAARCRVLFPGQL